MSTLFEPRIAMPDWKAWLSRVEKCAAKDLNDLDLRLAAAEWLLTSSLDINSIRDFKSLPSPNVEPFHHQVQNAILFFRRLAPRGLIADDVGLGKTVTAGLIARELIARGRVESILVVCPKSLMPQWAEEMSSKFGLQFKQAVGADFCKLSSHPFWVTTYSTARDRMYAIEENKFDLLILDEAHALRNLHGTPKPPIVALEFARLMREDAVRFCMMLTATPIQNRLWDIYSLLEILRAPQPNPLGEKERFSHSFVQDREGRVLVPGSKDRFRELVGGSTIRTRRADTGLLFPDREVRTELLEPLPDEKVFIEQAIAGILSLPSLVQVTHARTVMSSPWAAAEAFRKESTSQARTSQERAVFSRLAFQAEKLNDSAKTRAVVKLAMESAKKGRSGRIIVFTQRVATLSHLKAALESSGFKDQIGIISGSEPERSQASIKQFTAEPPPRPLLLSTDAGAVGLNLQAGNIVVNYDLPWNPMVLEQRIGRVQRLGQKAAKVIVYNLVLKGTIEDLIVRRLLEKLNLFHQAIGDMEELLELYDYDADGNKSLEEVIMMLIRKAGEQRDIEEDLRLAEESRRAAEKRLQEMKEATEKALASIRPADSGERLEGLERPTPRLDLKDVVKQCLRRAGAEFSDPPDGPFILKQREGDLHLVFDRQGASFSPPGARLRVIAPGTKAFEGITKKVRDEVAHHLTDASKAGLDLVAECLATQLAPLGMVLDRVEVASSKPAIALTVTSKVSATVASDKYETLLESKIVSPEDQVEAFLAPATSFADGAGSFPRVKSLGTKPLEETLGTLDGQIQRSAVNNTSVKKFCAFYEKRFQEDLNRLHAHLTQAGHRLAGRHVEDQIENAARANPEVKTALQSLQFRFVPRLSVEPVAVSGVHYLRAEVQAFVRNRRQGHPEPILVHAVPLSGILSSPLPIREEISGHEEGWACPGGHIVPERHFICCSESSCTTGVCRGCSEASATTAETLLPCDACARPFCAPHLVECHECHELVCGDDLAPLHAGADKVCARCVVELPDGRIARKSDVAISAVSGTPVPREELVASEASGRLALPTELAVCEATGKRALPSELVVCEGSGMRVLESLTKTSAVSGKRELEALMTRSQVSRKLCLPEEAVRCEESGEVLLPEESGFCSVTGLRVRKDLLELDSETEQQALRRLLSRSDVSRRFVRRERAAVSAVSGRIGLPSEIVHCSVCGKDILQDESLGSGFSGRVACTSHFQISDVTHAALLEDEWERCSVTGRTVEKSALRTCPDTGKRALEDEFVACDVTGAKVLPEALAQCSVTGRRVRANLLATCEATGRHALPDALVPCAVTGKRVHPDALITCPDSGARLLPDAAGVCAETGIRVHPEALGICAETGRSVRRSVMGTDDLTGDLVLGRLLQTCEETGKRTRALNFDASSVSGKRVLKSVLEQCHETGRLALSRELERCEQSGFRVHPDQLITCPESGRRILRRLAERCEVTGDLVSRDALGKCEFSGKVIRRSRLEVDELSGAPVQGKLLQTCEATGRRTVPPNLVRSAVSGKLVLASIATKCQESGAWALPDELEPCELSGKRVLPRLLHRCGKSGKAVLPRELRPCEQSGKRVLPEYLGHCSRSKKTVLKDLLGTSEISGDVGMAELMQVCVPSGRKAFLDELTPSSVSGRLFGKDRRATCQLCGRIGDLSELLTCLSCGQQVCPQEIVRDACRSCRAAVSRHTGRSLREEEIRLVQQHRPWAKEGWMVESAGCVHLVAQSGLLTLPRRSTLLVFRRAGPGDRSPIGVFLEDRPIDPALKAGSER